ncbi:hypothetical protein Pyrde_0053 [Pyrodictium delaneyi]|uniref:Uncharacterized protein n=1 Tax=Pyrodictium delaneyi TaxID=1273541 RepID=A0A0P0N0H8_9CREN|nr:hypothetical protein Pyrde_0053 [Pyrodictium delaneyi]
MYLAGQRNIAKVLEEYAPRPGEHVVIALAYSIKAGEAVPRPSERLEPVENCVDTECSHYRSRVTRLAVFPIEERIYRFSETL